MTIRKHTLSDGTVRYEARYKRNGQETNRRFEKRAEAVQWLAVMRNQRTSANVRSLTVGETIAWHIETAKPTGSNFYELVKLQEYCRNIRVSDLNHSVVSQILEKILDEKKRNGEPIALSTARKNYFYFKVAVESYCNRHNISINSTAFTVKPPPAWKVQKDTRITDEQIEQLVAAMKNKKQFYRDFFIGLLQTAGRKQEVLEMRFSEIKGNIWYLPAERSKTRKSRVIPILPVLAKVIERRRSETEGDLVFYDCISSQMAGVYLKRYKPAWAKDITIHTFRHEATCRLVEKTSLKMEEIMKITGHDEMKTFFRYYKLRPEFNLEGIEAL